MEAAEQTRLAPPVLRTAAGTWPRPVAAGLQRRVQDLALPATASLFVFVAVLVLTGLNEHVIAGVRPGAATQLVRALAPLLAASVATWAIHRPWPAYVAVLALTPIWNSALMEWRIGPIQVILQTVFLAALIAGCAIRSRTAASTHPLWAADIAASPAANAERAGTAARIRGITGRYSAYRFAQVALAGFAAIAIASTIASPDVVSSATVLMHGILEPIAMGAVLIWLRPTRRDLVAVGAGLGVAIALTSLVSIVQTVPDYRSLGALQIHRLAFTRVAFSNVGYFGVAIATVVPMIVGLLAIRNSLRLSRYVSAALPIVLPLTLAGLFLTFSKSAWLASAAGAALLILLLAPTWRHRLAMVAAAALVSAAFIPWPALALQVAPPADHSYRTAMVGLMGQARYDSWNPTTLAGRGSLSERFYATDAGVRMALDHPLLGVGLNQFRTYYITLGYRPAAAKDVVDHAHSLFPEVAAELGLPAMSLLAIGIGAAAWAMWRAYRRAHDRLTRALAAGLLASLTGWVVAATAFGCDIYRANRDMASDVMIAAVIVAMAIALARTITYESKAVGRAV